MKNTVTFKEIEYDIMIINGDIHLQSLNQDIILAGEYDRLMRTIIQEHGRSYYEHDDSISVDYDKEHIEDLVNESISDHAFAMADSGTVIKHNLN